MHTDHLRTDQASRITSYPVTELDPFIYFFHEENNTFKNAGKASITFLLPQVGFTLLFNLHNRFKIETKESGYLIDRWLLLPGNSTYIFQDPGHYFSIHFKFSFLPFTRHLSQSSITSPVQTVEFLNQQFIKQIASAGNFQERVYYSQRYFLHLFTRYKKQTEKVQFLIDKINNLLNDQSDLFDQSEYYLSDKTLTRHFLRYTGITYKKGIRILRIRSALRSFIQKDRNINLEDFGFYDHSHFYKEIKIITGFTIKDLKANLHMENSAIL